MKVGFIGGKFLPLHLGHVYAIISASSMVDELYVVLSHSQRRDQELCKQTKMSYIPPRIRLRWLTQLTKDMPHVKVIEVEDDQGIADYNWEVGASLIKDKIGKPIDVVFSSEEGYEEYFRKFYPSTTHILIDPERSHMQVSATKIREEGVFHNWEFIPDIVRPFFIKKVVIVGTESCGKSTLTKNLAKIYNTTFVSEYGRTVCEELGGCANIIMAEDYYKIAYGHKLDELKAVENANKLLFIDTEAIVTQFYAQLYSDETYPVLEEIAKLQEYSLWLFLEPDVKWIDDGLRVHGAQSEREANNHLLKSFLDKNNIEYHSLQGNYDDRLKQALELINEMMA